MLMASVCLRRRKDMEFQGRKILELPGVDEYIYPIGMFVLRWGLRIDFTPTEREKYMLLENDAKELLRNLQRNNRDERSYAFALEILLRMRQLAVLFSL